ncbi:Hypothetical predicted protein [Cloeon dipterum]|uniref:Uncharacterized protein n=1 Tax=Cloeon dipterum TaxID=197152 RepID=A0A8S1CJ13_9INSE|nr:Hypothetical predicted protein [Cloeon dipterum]
MNIDLLGRIRKVFSFSPPRRVGTEMEPKRPERSNRPPRSKSAGTLSQSQEELQEDIAEVHRRPKKNETESLLLDRELLENLVWRLNVELGRYETRLRALEGQDNVPDGDRAAPAWCRADPTTLGPLLVAYDEALAEKDSVIEKYESRLKELGAELREVISENERLHEAFEEVQNESVLEREERELASKDVESLHSENVALLGRLEDYKARVEELEEILLEQRNDFVKRSEEMVQQQAQMKALARNYRVLQDQLDEACREIENRVPQQHHQSSINECKTLLEELRSSYDKDRRILEDRLAAMTKEKVEAEAKARAAMSEAAHMEAKAKATEKLLRELQRLENLVRLIAAKRYCCEESVIGPHRSKLNQKPAGADVYRTTTIELSVTFAGEKMGKTAKVVVCGARGVGKTAILEQRIHGHITAQTELYPTIEDIYPASVATEKGSKELLRFFDTAGLGLGFTSELPRHYFANADGYVIVYDPDEPESFNVVLNIKKDIEKYREKKEVVITVLANRRRGERTYPVDIGQASQWATREKVRLHEVDAMDRSTLFDPFTQLATRLNPPQQKSAFSQLGISRKIKEAGDAEPSFTYDVQSEKR